MAAFKTHLLDTHFRRRAASIGVAVDQDQIKKQLFNSFIIYRNNGRFPFSYRLRVVGGLLQPDLGQSLAGAQQKDRWFLGVRLGR